MSPIGSFECQYNLECFNIIHMLSHGKEYNSSEDFWFIIIHRNPNIFHTYPRILYWMHFWCLIFWMNGEHVCPPHFPSMEMIHSYIHSYLYVWRVLPHLFCDTGSTPSCLAWQWLDVYVIIKGTISDMIHQNRRKSSKISFLHFHK